MESYLPAVPSRFALVAEAAKYEHRFRLCALGLRENLIRRLNDGYQSPPSANGSRWKTLTFSR